MKSKPLRGGGCGLGPSYTSFSDGVDSKSSYWQVRLGSKRTVTLRSANGSVPAVSGTVRVIADRREANERLCGVVRCGVERLRPVSRLPKTKAHRTKNVAARPCTAGFALRVRRCKLCLSQLTSTVVGGKVYV